MDNFRFDIVVLNYNRVQSFFNNFNKIINFNKDIDRITIITSSPSLNESALIKSFENSNGISIRYLARKKNEGIDQLARIQYFLGEVGEYNENLKYQFIFQMQEHYLDTISPHSKWGKELNYKIKGDVVPDNILFDLDEIAAIFNSLHIKTLFCDRNNPCFFTVKGQKYIAPNGGNFILLTSLLFNSKIRNKIEHLKKTFSNTYDWGVFAEFFWGETFFAEGQGTYDYKRRKYFSDYKKDDFYDAPDDYDFLRRRHLNLFKKYIRMITAPGYLGLKKIYHLFKMKFNKA